MGLPRDVVFLQGTKGGVVGKKRKREAVVEEEELTLV